MTGHSAKRGYGRGRWLIYIERWLLFGGREAKGCSCKGEGSVLERLGTARSLCKVEQYLLCQSWRCTRAFCFEIWTPWKLWTSACQRRKAQASKKTAPRSSRPPEELSRVSEANKSSSKVGNFFNVAETVCVQVHKTVCSRLERLNSSWRLRSLILCR